MDGLKALLVGFKLITDLYHSIYKIKKEKK